MRKKLLYIFFGACLTVGLLAGAVYFFTPRTLSHLPSKENCAFCTQKVLDAQTIYEDDLVRVLYPYQPIVPGHFLIIPKRHVERFEELTDEEMLQISRVIKKVHKAAVKEFDADSYLILQKNGIEAGQTVPHVHFHYIARKKGEDSIPKFFIQLYLTTLKTPLTPLEMKEPIDRLKRGLESTKEEDSVKATQEADLKKAS